MFAFHVKDREKNTQKLLFFVCVFLFLLSPCVRHLFCSLSSFSLTHRESVAGKRITDVLHLLCVFVIVSLFFVDMCIFIYLSRVTQVTNIKSSRLRLALFVSSQSHFIIHSFFSSEYSDAVKIVVVCRSVCFFSSLLCLILLLLLSSFLSTQLSRSHRARSTIDMLFLLFYFFFQIENSLLAFGFASCTKG